MTLQDNTAQEVDMEEPDKAKAGSREPTTMEATGVSKDGHPMQAAMEAGLGKMEDQSGKANAENWEDRSRSCRFKDSHEAIPSNKNGGNANKLNQCKAVCHLLSRREQTVKMQICLIQKPWFFKGPVRDKQRKQLVYYRGGVGGPELQYSSQECKVMWYLLLQLGLVAVQRKCEECKDQKDEVVCSVDFQSDSVKMPISIEFKELVEYCSEKKKLGSE